MEPLFLPSEISIDTEELVIAIMNELRIEPTISKIRNVITLATAITRENAAGTKTYIVFDDQERQELVLTNPPTATEISFIIWLIDQDHFGYDLVCQRCNRIVLPRRGLGIPKRICGLCTGLYG